MISYLKIKNFALIESQEIDFNQGFNVITGETGAGKSLIIKAISLLIGERSDSSMIREGSKEAEIQAVFQVSDKVKNFIHSKTENMDSNSLIVRRVFNHKGGKIFVNDSTISLNLLNEIMSKIVNICGQHEYQILKDENEQMELVDDFGNYSSDLMLLKEFFKQMKMIKKEIESLTMDEITKEREIDYLNFQLSEILDVDPSENEDDLLSNKEEEVKQAKINREATQNIYNLLYNDENDLMSQIEKLKNEIKLTNENEDILSLLTELIPSLDSLGMKIKKEYNRSVDDDDLTEVYDRIEKIKKLKRKYGGTISSVLEKKEEFQNKLLALKNSDKKIIELENERKKILEKYKTISSKISQQRKDIAAFLSDSITKELQELNMKGSSFKIQVTPSGFLTSKGQDKIEFLVATNKGETMNALNKIASGGELSRIMLALTKIVSEKRDISLYIFDEIDAGIGGETGLVIGKKIKEISSVKQTLCITHLAQVASFSNDMLFVSKKEENGRVKSNVMILSKENDKIQEIARMLSGNNNPQSLAHAKELINSCR